MYKWYDSLKDPKRFLVFFIPAAILIVAIYEAPYPFNVIAGGLLLFAGITRAFYIHRSK